MQETKDKGYLTTNQNTNDLDTCNLITWTKAQNKYNYQNTKDKRQRGIYNNGLKKTA